MGSQGHSVSILAQATVQFKSFAMITTPAHGKELRIARWDKALTPYSQEEFLDYYTPESGWDIWRDAVPYKDAAGKIRHVLVKIGAHDRWGFVDRISQESALLAGMLSCDDDSPVLDLSAIVGCDLSYHICMHILEYLCGYQSHWWETEPCMGALDAADKLGLERLLSSIVSPQRKDRWESGRSRGAPMVDCSCAWSASLSDVQLTISGSPQDVVTQRGGAQ